MKVLNKIQRELKAPKDKSAKQYKYRSCESILEAVKPLLGDEATLVMSDTIEQVGDRFYVKATVTIKSGDESVSVSAYAREPLMSKFMSEPQLTGAAGSYARKYALCGLFCIDDNQDIDTEPPVERPEPTGVEVDAIEAIYTKLLDSVPEGQVLVADKLPAILWSVGGGKYPNDIEKATITAGWLIEQGAMKHLTEQINANS